MDSGQLNTNASAAAQQAGRKLGGFVAFLVRRDAERAVKEMDGAEWGDSTLRCGWGKAVPIAQRALYGQYSRFWASCLARNSARLIQDGHLASRILRAGTQFVVLRSSIATRPLVSKVGESFFSFPFPAAVCRVVFVETSRRR